MMMNASSDEWTVVTAANKKRVMRKKGTRKRCPTTTSSRPSSRSPLTTEELLRGLSECQDFILSQTSLWCEVDEKIRRILPLDTRPVKEIVCLGLGNFSLTGASYYEAPLFQLALARCLQQYFAPSHGSYPPLIVHDPCFLSTEVAFLHDHVGAKSPPCSATGAYTATGDTIFFLPHCPRGLHENLVRANWKSPHVLVVISNSLTDLADRMLPAASSALGQLTSSTTPRPNSKDLFQEFPLLPLPPTEVEKAPGNLLGAFNDTAVHRIGAADSQLEDASSAAWPELCPPTTTVVDPELVYEE